MKIKDIKNFIEYLFVRIVFFIFRLLPLGVSSWVAIRLSEAIIYLLPKRKKIALENLDRAFKNALTTDQKEVLALTTFKNACLSIFELFIVEKMKHNAASHFTLIGNEHLENAFAQGSGVILVISHLGSWEYLAFLPFLTKHPWSVIVKDIKNSLINRYIDRLRRVMTVNPIPKVGSIKPVMKELKKNHGVAILIDQWAGPEGLWVDFFGTPTSTTSIPARLAKKTNAVLIPAYCLRQSFGKYEIHIEPEIPVNLNHPDWEINITRNLNQWFESTLKKYPEQWIWSHKRWKNKPRWIRHDTKDIISFKDTPNACPQ